APGKLSLVMNVGSECPHGRECDVDVAPGADTVPSHTHQHRNGRLRRCHQQRGDILARERSIDLDGYLILAIDGRRISEELDRRAPGLAARVDTEAVERYNQRLDRTLAHVLVAVEHHMTINECTGCGQKTDGR